MVYDSGEHSSAFDWFLLEGELSGDAGKGQSHRIERTLAPRSKMTESNWTLGRGWPQVPQTVDETDYDRVAANFA
jgi:hypothetical protein